MIRKNIFVLISVTFLTFLIANTNAQNRKIIDGLVGRWEFSDKTGKNLSGNESHAVLNGTQIY